MKARATLCVLVVAQLLASSADAASRDPRARVAGWNERLVKVDEQLKRGDYAAVRDETKKLASEMVKHAGSGGDAMYTLGVTTAFRAIAEAGLRNLEDAAWYWRVASALYPPFLKTDLSIYGEPGKFLGALPPLSPEERKRNMDEQQQHRVEPPKLLKRRDPEYPETLRRMGIAKPIVVEAVVDAAGVPYEPRLVTPDFEPAFIYVVMEAMKQWRFEPARLDGEEVPFVFNLTVNFRLR